MIFIEYPKCSTCKKDKIPKMKEDEMLEILSTNGMLVKRPLIISDDVILTGFKEKEWEDNLL